MCNVHCVYVCQCGYGNRFLCALSQCVSTHFLVNKIWKFSSKSRITELSKARFIPIRTHKHIQFAQFPNVEKKFKLEFNFLHFRRIMFLWSEYCCINDCCECSISRAPIRYTQPMRCVRLHWHCIVLQVQQMPDTVPQTNYNWHFDFSKIESRLKEKINWQT